MTQTFGGILWNIDVKEWGAQLHSALFTKHSFPYISNTISILDSWVIYRNYNVNQARLQLQQPNVVLAVGMLFLLLAGIIAVSLYLWRRHRQRCDSGGASFQITRRRSNSYGNSEFEALLRNRNRSFSNESWIKHSPRNRAWSNTFRNSSNGNNNNSRASLLGHKVPIARRRFSSISRPHSSTDVVRDSDVQNDSTDDVTFWQTLEQEEEETRMRQIRDRTSSSKHSAGSKGNSSKAWSSSQSSLRLLGPSVTSIEYSTITPPPTWSKANRKLILSDKAWDLSRIISLELLSADAFTVGTATLLIEKTKARSAQPNHNHSKGALKGSVMDYSVHVHSPPESGVFDIYAKGCDHSEWMEQTFSSASAAAQFQLDLLALQMVGPSIQNLYAALQIIHKGSSIYIGDEPVLHNTSRVVDDATGELRIDSTPESGIAWDDVMRCLGSSFPSIRLRLEAMRWLEVYSFLESMPSTARRKDVPTDAPGDEMKDATLATPNSDPEHARYRAYTEMDSLYRNRRRLLLGPVDFFRLFVPKLPETALPEADCSRSRMEQLLRLRKRVARAAVLVRAYTRARMVVNRGWNIAPDIQLPEAYWTRRYAFDDDIDNHQHDSTASNVYYEGTVSRDVDCQVRGLNYFKVPSRSKRSSTETPLATSLYQAYSLVGIHSFEWSGDDDSCPLHYKKDPVQSIVSIHDLIAGHPDLDFFVFAVFLPSQDTAIVHVYARSLPKAIDPKFDNTINRFIQGDEILRKKKLEVMLQLEIDKNGLSFLERCLLWWLLLLLRLTVGRRYQAPNPSPMNDRTSLPPLVLSDCGETFHFGGSLRSDPMMPNNYFAATAHLFSVRNCNLITRMMLSYIELGGLSRNVADVTFILAGDNENELPERALCTSRTVHATLTKLPIAFVSPIDTTDSAVEVSTTSVNKKDRGIASLLFKLFVVDPTIAAIEAIIRSAIEFHNSSTSPNQLVQTMASPLNSSSEKAVVDGSTTDPFEKAINKIIRILDGIKIPMKSTDRVSENLATSEVAGVANAEYEKISILQTINRFDISRYFVASNCNPKEALCRIVESALWRGTTFPVDLRTCRIELQAGQFFHQGFDLDGNPVFYFQNMCLGPWRKDEDALIAAVLHRLESTLNQITLKNPLAQCTLIVLCGKPHSRHSNRDVDETNKGNTDGQSTIASTAMSTLTGTAEANEGSMDQNEDMEHENVAPLDNENSEPRSNPRMFFDEHWNVHTSRSVIERLVHILMTHYPERLARALVVVGHGNKKYALTAIGGVLFLTGMVPSTKTRDKVRFLTRYRDLESYVHRTQLVALVGGTQGVDIGHYECR